MLTQEAVTGRPKTGGRKRGRPNRRTADIEEKLAAMGCDPIAGMAAITLDEKPRRWPPRPPNMGGGGGRPAPRMIVHRVRALSVTTILPLMTCTASVV